MSDVDAFLGALEHSRKDEIEAVRAIVLGSMKGITERVKWNAPSFCIDGDDRVTFRLQPGDRVQLVFHRGAKVKSGSKGFAFEDPSGLLEWAASDRAVLTFASLKDVKAKKAALAKLVKAWMTATRG